MPWSQGGSHQEGPRTPSHPTHTPVLPESFSHTHPSNSHHLNLPSLFFQVAFLMGFQFLGQPPCSRPPPQSRRLGRRNCLSPYHLPHLLPGNERGLGLLLFLCPVLDSLELPGQNRPLISRNKLTGGRTLVIQECRAACLRQLWWSCPLLFRV